ncbi:MAG TPA: SprT-like domain-containing protein [Candidatus Dormibacteraeota bacterium]|nr:SprT-like domain-containing protein [Candidatus Dormibacteraeota bacterium]
MPSEAELQLLFARLNLQYFGGEIPPYRIAYNGRFSTVAGRIIHKPPTIELSPKHFRRHPERLEETLLHEMIHAWLDAKGMDSGHTSAFKRKMRELGIASIYHDMGRIEKHPSGRRYILKCPHCAVELLRRRRPPENVSCGRCSRRAFDARYRLRVYQIVGVLDLSDPEGRELEAPP